jgi:2-oxoglutarate dehydrogenase E2 component (dihydrolipoamide succinyltransferase)
VGQLHHQAVHALPLAFRGGDELVDHRLGAVGESITEVTIAKWLKKDGEAVKRDEVIAELESDKATFELPAEADGVLKIRVAEGETIGIGTVIADLDGAATGAAPAPAAAPPAPAGAVEKENHPVF